MDPRDDARGRREDAASAPDSTDIPARRRLRWGEAVWLTILAAIGVVQVVRAQWFDAAVFFVTVAALGADSLGLVPQSTVRRSPRTRGVVVVATVVAVALCFVPRHGTWMGIGVIAVGVAVLVLIWPQPRGTERPPWPRGLRRLAVAWSVILVVGCLWELLQFILGRVEPRLQWFALSDLVDPLVAGLPGRILFIAAWLGAGLFLVGRGRRS